jgi:hypothetical protein
MRIQFAALSLSRKTICYYNYIAKKPDLFFSFLFFCEVGLFCRWFAIGLHFKKKHVHNKRNIKRGHFF